MKKFFALLLVLLLLCSCTVQEEPVAEEPQSEAEVSESEPEENIKIVENCIFKSPEGKYGVCKNENIVFAAEYDVFKFVGEIGEKKLYALGKIKGTMPKIIYDENARVSGIGEREKILYEFFFEDGTLLPLNKADSYTFERNKGYKPGTKFWLYISFEGSQYIYEFDKEGEIASEKNVPSGKTGDIYNDYICGFEKIRYYYGPTDMEMGLGLADTEGNEVVPAIYSYIYSPFEERIVAGRSEGGLLGGTCRILDGGGNIICDKYHLIDFDELPDGRFIGIAYCAGKMSQLAAVCRDENGNIMEGGYRFIDKDGNELSEIFIDEKDDFIFRKGGITEEETTITAIYKDGSKKEINIYDYAFEP